MNTAFWRETTSWPGIARQIGLAIVAGPVAQWITRLTTDQKIPGSNPGKLECFFTSVTFFGFLLCRSYLIRSTLF